MLIYVDGPDGAGKSTLCAALKNAIPNSTLFAFPSYASLPGRLIRNVFDGAQVDPRAMLWLFVAEAIDMEPEIGRLIASGSTVIADRHTTISARVYQTDLHTAEEVEQVLGAAHLRLPDRTYILDLAPEAALVRMRARGPLNPLFESANLEKLETRRSKYNQVARVLGACVLDASKPVAELAKFVLDDIDDQF